MPTHHASECPANFNEQNASLLQLTRTKLRDSVLMQEILRSSQMQPQISSAPARVGLAPFG